MAYLALAAVACFERRSEPEDPVADGVSDADSDADADRPCLAPDEEWSVARVGEVPQAGAAAFIDRDGAIHLAYSSGRALAYVRFGEGSEDEQIIADGGQELTSVSLAAGASGAVHVAYVDATDGKVWHATNGDGSWETATVDARLPVSWATSVAVGRDDTVHLSYFSAESDDPYGSFTRLNRAVRRDGEWDLSMVIESSVWKTRTAVGEASAWKTRTAVGFDGRAYVAIAGPGGVAVYSPDTESYGWPVLSVGTGYDEASGLSLAIDEGGAAHVSFFDHFSGAIRYATTDEKCWSYDACETYVDPDVVGYEDLGTDALEGSQTALTVDDSGGAHIAYSAGPARTVGRLLQPWEIRYATNSAGIWVTERLAATDDPHEYREYGLRLPTPWIALQDGRLEVAFLDRATGELRRASASCGPDPSERECVAIEEEPNDAPLMATRVCAGALIEAELGDSDHDYYALVLRAGERLTAEVSTEDGCGIDSVAELLGGHGTDADPDPTDCEYAGVLACDDDSGRDACSQLIYEATSSGPYYLLVREASSATSPYRLSIEIEQAP